MTALLSWMGCESGDGLLTLIARKTHGLSMNINWDYIEKNTIQ